MKTGTSSACLGDRMRIINRSPSEWRLRVESVDDLWVLANAVRPGSGFAMLGERRDQTTAGEAGGRAKQAERKKMWIRLKVERTEHQAFSEHLRVHGTIEEAAFDVGLHHTHVVDLHDEVVLTAHPSLPQVDQDLLSQSEAAAAHAQVALLVVEHDEMILFFVTGRGLRESATWTMRGGGKRGDIRQSEGVAASFRGTTVHGLNEQLPPDMPLVLCGPGQARDRMMHALRQAGHQRTMMSVATDMGGRGAANQVLSEGLAGELLAHHHMVKETALLDEAWRRISTGGAVAYGMASIVGAIEEGAVETLLIAAEVLRDSTDGAWEAAVENLLAFGGEVVQCSLNHDAGEQLTGLGGAVALLRYAR